MRIPGWLFIVGVVILVLGTTLCSVLAFNATYQVATDLGRGGVQVASFSDFLRAQPTPTLTPTPAPTLTPLPGETAVPATPVPEATLDPLASYTWDDPRRVNILLLGIDQRGDEPGPFRTDTMIVVSVDPVRKTAGMLSIPRDLWVTIPGFQPQRINQANALGDANAYPGGGPALAARTVTENIGINVQKFILVNFDVFTAVVDLIAPNGVEVCPTEPIDDPDYPDAGYGTIPVYFDAGCQRLNAERLLQYARTRATQGSDFDRAARQQEVIKSLLNEVLSAGGITNFLGQIPALWEELAGSFQTNLSQQEIISLAVLAQEIPAENIHSGVINNLYVNLATTTTGDQVLIPRHNALSSLLQQVFDPQDELSLSDLRARAEAEQASVVVYNNTDIAGLAGQTRDWLISRQVSVTAVGNTPAPSNTFTIIRDYTGKIWTARYLAALMGLPPERVQPGADGATTEDVMVVVGPDVQTLLNGQ